MELSRRLKGFWCRHAGLILGAAAVICWGFNAAVSRRLLESLGLFTGGGCICLAGGLVCFLLQPPRRLRFSPRYHGLCGAMVVAYLLFFNLALGLAPGRAQAVEISLINYLWPMLTLVLAIPVLHKRARPLLLTAGILLSIAGLALSTSLLSGIALTPAALWCHFCGGPLPYLFGTAAAVLWALYSDVLATVDREVVLDGMPWFMIIAGALLLALRIPFHETGVVITPAAVWQLIFMALVPIGCGYCCWDLAMRRRNTLPAITFSYLTPLFSAVFSALILKVRLPLLFYAACLMVIAGALICRRAFSRHQK